MVLLHTHNSLFDACSRFMVDPVLDMEKRDQLTFLPNVGTNPFSGTYKMEIYVENKNY